MCNRKIAFMSIFRFDFSFDELGERQFSSMSIWKSEIENDLIKSFFVSI